MLVVQKPLQAQAHTHAHARAKTQTQTHVRISATQRSLTTAGNRSARPQLVVCVVFLCVKQQRPVTNGLAFLTGATLSFVLLYVVFFAIQHATLWALLQPAHAIWLYVFAAVTGLVAIIAG